MEREWILACVEGMFIKGYIRVRESEFVGDELAFRREIKDTAGSKKAKRIQRSTGNWWVSDEHLPYCCSCEVGDWGRKVLKNLG